MTLFYERGLFDSYNDITLKAYNFNNPAIFVKPNYNP
jgi:hypothetical protein